MVSDGVGSCDSGPASPPRAYPACVLRSHAPLSSRTKGAGWMDVPSAEAPAFAGMTEGVSYDGGLRRGDSRIAPTFGYSPPVTAVISNSV